MLNILKSEFLKTKHSGVWRDVVVIPLVAVAIAWLLAGSSVNLMQQAVFWWEAIFLFLFIGLLLIGDHKIEHQAGDFQNVVGSGKEDTIYLAKIIVKVVCVAIANILLAIEVILVIFVDYHATIDYKPLLITFTGFTIATAWTLPLLYILSRKINSYVLMAMNTLIGMIIVPVVGSSAFWIFVPYTYHYRLTENLCGVAINGTPITTFTQPHFAPCLLPIVVSALLFICLVVVLKKVITHGKNYSK